MKKSMINLALIVCLSPLLIQCIASEKDVAGLDMRLRTLDTRTVEMDHTLSAMKALPGSQAELANQMDKFKARLLQIEAQLEEKTIQTRKILEEQIAFKKSTGAKLDQLADQTNSLNAKLGETSNQLSTALGNFNRLQGAQAKEAEEKATVAAKEAEEARKKAESAGKTGTIEPDQTKKKKTAKAEDSAKKEPNKAGQSEPASSDPGYDKGLAAYKEKNYKKAYSLFHTFLEKNPSAALAPNARFWQGDCLFQQKEYELAILEYQKVIADYPRSNKVPAALLKQGQAFERLDEKETAKIVYTKIVNDHPNSEQLEAAQKRLKALK